MAKSLAEQLAAAQANVDLTLATEILSDGAAEKWEQLRWDWRFWGRPEQWLPSDPWTYWLMLAGRGAGKTRSAAEAVRQIVASGQVEYSGFVAKTPADARDVMIEGPSGILAVTPPHDRPEWEPSKRRLTWPNGASATVFSGENPDQLRGPQHQLIWCDEICFFARPDETWDNLALGLRVPWRDGGPARAIVTTTPRPIKVLKHIMSLSNCVMTRGTTYDNKNNLDPGYLKQMLHRYAGTRLGRQELEGHLLEDVVGALWKAEEIDANRVAAASELVAIVVAIDPAASSGPLSAETGIIGVGRGADGHGYVLEDKSGVFSPKGWARRAVDMYHGLSANEIVAEVNNGGDMVKQIIHDVDPSVPVRMVRAAVGKMRRAEPVAALYEDAPPTHPCRFHHVGTFPELEEQLCSFTGSSGDRSPDRLDALVWGAFAVVLKVDFAHDDFDLGLDRATGNPWLGT